VTLPGWIDGRVVAADAAALTLGDSAHTSGVGCYTTARWLGASIWHVDRSARRLARDAHTLGLGDLDEARVALAMAELGAACFGAEPGIVRFEASRSAAGNLCLTGTARALGPEPDRWQAASAPFCHPGPAPWGGAKVTSHLLFVHARDHGAALGADECLLFDAAGYLVEGARSSPLFVDSQGHLCTPPATRGGVTGVGLDVLRARFPELREADISRSELAHQPEILSVNSVRGPVPVVRLDGQPIGDGEPGPWAARLRSALAPPFLKSRE